MPHSKWNSKVRVVCSLILTSIVFTNYTNTIFQNYLGYVLMLRIPADSNGLKHSYTQSTTELSSSSAPHSPNLIWGDGAAGWRLLMSSMASGSVSSLAPIPIWPPSSRCVRMCFRSAAGSLKLRLQKGQQHGLSPVWMSWWCLRCCRRLRRFPQMAQTYGFSPVCVRLCLRKPSKWRKQLPHSEQEYGFSPVCMRRWVLRAPDSRKRRPQTPQGYGFSPVWMRMCFFRLEMRRKVFPHSKQWWGRSPLGSTTMSVAEGPAESSALPGEMLSPLPTPVLANGFCPSWTPCCKALVQSLTGLWCRRGWVKERWEPPSSPTWP